MQVGYNTIVSLRYCMKNSTGDVVEDILQSPPVEYLHGSGNILPGLEAALEGLQPGDEKLVVISTETGNQLNGRFSFDVIVDGVRPATEEEQKKGKPLKPEMNNDCGPGCCC